MTKLPQLKSGQVIKALKRLGFQVVRQRGSHVRLSHSNGRLVSVPYHNRPLFVGTLHSILSQANIPIETLLENL